MLAVAIVSCASLASAAGAPAATLSVSTIKDELVAHDGKCSLREAIATSASAGRHTDCGTADRRSNTIALRSGRYVLSIAPAPGDDNAGGDLNVTGTAPLTIIGAGPSATVIDAGGLRDRVLSVAPTATLTLRRLRISGGHPPDGQPGPAGRGDASCAAGGDGATGFDAGDAGSGGGVLNAGTLVLDTVAVIGNHAGTGGPGGTGSPGGPACSGGNGGQGGSGGGVFNRGRLTVTDSTIRGNSGGTGGAGGGGGQGGTGGPGGPGGGIYNQGRLSVSASAIFDNRAGAGGVGGPAGGGVGTREDGGGGSGSWGGGIFSVHGTLRVENSTLVGNSAGGGGAGGGATGGGGNGGNGGAVAVITGASLVRNATAAENAVGAGGVAGSDAGILGASGQGGGLYALSETRADDMRLENAVVASNRGANCGGTPASAIANGGHDLSYGDGTCPGGVGNPKLGPLQDNGGATETMALGAGSAAINRIPRRRTECPSTDQRGVRRPQRGTCDIGAYEFATPTITITSPSRQASYERGSRIVARFRCDEGGVATAIATCTGSIPRGHVIRMGRAGTERFVVSATDKSGSRARKTVRYFVFKYLNPLREVSGLTPRRIDLGVDYAGSGPLLALGDGVVTMATDSDDGPSSCWAISCWPGGGIVVYRLTDGPFAGKYVYVAEHIGVTVRAGQRVNAGQQIATLYQGYPWVELGWAAGPGPEALGIADGHGCSCGDPGGWSTIDGRDFDQLLVRLGAPSGWLQPTPHQSMPRGWPTWPR